MRTTAALLFFATAALGQGRTDELYVSSAHLVSSARFMALSGASVGIGENAEGLATNYAAVAQRSAHRTRRWDWDLTFSLLTAPLEGWRDFDNDEKPAPFVQPVEAQVGAFLQIWKLGFGVFGKLAARNLCLRGDCNDKLSTNTVHGGLIIGLSILEDQLVLGIGLNLSSAQFQYGFVSYDYSGSSFGTGILLRFKGQPWRLGTSLLTAHVGHLPAGITATQIAGLPLFAGVSAPTQLTMGGSVRLGRGNERYNRVALPPVDEPPKTEEASPGQAPPPTEPPEDKNAPPGAVLITAQLDVIFPVVNATGIRSFLFSEPPVPMGASLYLVPRLGVEWELLTKRLRLRAGTWLEPNLVAGSSVRPHGTFGFELFVIHFLDDWNISAAIDAAPRYFAVSFGIGFWR